MTTTATSLRAETRSLLGLGMPLVGSFVAGFLIHMTDTVMLGWYSILSLAAATIATSTWFILFIMGAGFAHAVMPLVAAAEAEGDTTQARRATRMGLWLSVAYFALAFPPLWWSEAVLLWLGQTAEVAAEGQRYLRIAVFGMVPALLAQVLRSYLSGLQLTGVQLWVTVSGVFLNAVVNYALIFGNLGAPELGIEGAAIASVLIQCFTLIVLAIYAQVKLPDYVLFQRIWRPDWQALWRLFVLGVPIGLTSLAEGGLFNASAIMMGWIGEKELAAHGIALQVTALTFMFHVGMSQAATIRAGGAFGRRDEAALRTVGKAAHLIAFAFGVAVVVIFVAIPGPLAGAFLDPTDPARDAIIEIGIVLILLSALFQFVDSGQIVALSLLRGVQDTNVPMWLATLSYWVIGVPASYIMAFVLGWEEVGLWLGLTVGLGCAAISLSARFWLHTVRIAR
ncbi:MATE family efflux transporter [Loktanella sp. IMCC34160]|uniref:MATE family efflux transporter n=1 Tax=Loktanella sp. IMCC34160 TaxID=2510646 RepID=UPI00101DAE50|nr:MATE family efflux transporter [Loktanella sp. IMCC34160]RYG93033.1 MATE family efflux transporter [Loktanella sp. IMCC34160]